MSRPIRTTSGGFPDATDVRNVAGSKSFSVKSSVTSGYCSTKRLTRVVPISSAPPSPGVHGMGSQPYLASIWSVPLMSAAPGEPALGEPSTGEAPADAPADSAGGAADVPGLDPLSLFEQAPIVSARAAASATVAR